MNEKGCTECRDGLSMVCRWSTFYPQAPYVAFVVAEKVESKSQLFALITKQIDSIASRNAKRMFERTIGSAGRHSNAKTAIKRGESLLSGPRHGRDCLWFAVGRTMSRLFIHMIIMTKLTSLSVGS
jgi:hypothetical protein